MKKSVIWIAAGVAGIGLGIPAHAAMSPQHDAPRSKTQTTVATIPDVAGDDTATTVVSTRPPVVSATTPNTVEDSTHDSVDDSTHNSIDDSADDNIVVTTANTVEDVSGPCDEIEHANDPRCSSGPSAPSAPSVDDNSGRDGGGHGSDDPSGHGHRNDG